MNESDPEQATEVNPKQPTAIFASSSSEENKKEERYEVLKVLGEGGMGIVQLVKDKILNREVAQKTIKDILFSPVDSVSEKKKLWRFRREAEITGKLEHPNIVPLYDFEENKGEIRFTMRKVEGETFRAILQKKRDPQNYFEEDQLLSILLKICEAVAYAHSRGIIHRDLKPENIMVGQFGEVYVMDWGIAKQQDQELSQEQEAFLCILPQNLQNLSSQKNALGVATPKKTTEKTSLAESQNETKYHTLGGLGTPGYMPPEQIKDAASVTFQSDIYALGQILKECYTRLSPLDEFRLELNQISTPKFPQSKAPRRNSLEEKIPEDIYAILKKAKSKKKEDRYKNVSQFMEEIRRYQKHEWIQARKLKVKDILDVLRKWIKRHPQGVLFGGLVFLFLVAFQSVFYYQKKQQLDHALQMSYNLHLKGQRILIQNKTLQAEKVGYLLKAFNLINEVLVLNQEKDIQRKTWNIGQDLVELSCESNDFQLALFVVDSLAKLNAIDLQEKIALKNKTLYERDKLEQQHLKDLKTFKQKYLEEKINLNESEEILIAISKMQEKAVFNELIKEVEEGVRYFLKHSTIDKDYSSYYTIIVRSLGYLEYPESCGTLFEGLKNLAEKESNTNPSFDHQTLMAEITKSLANLDANEEISTFIGDLRTTKFSRGLYFDLSKESYKKLVSTTVKYYSEQIKNDPQNLIQIQPTEGTHYNYRAMTKQYLKKNKLALQDLDNAVQLDPKNADFYTNYKDVQNYQNTIENYTKVIELNPKDNQLYALRGEIQILLKNYENAIEDYTKAIDLDPKNADYYNNRSFAKQYLQDFQGAIEDLNRAIQLNPENPDYDNNRAEAEIKLLQKLEKK